MSANWFIAFRVHAPSLDLEAPASGVRLFDREDLHATIAFLGGIDEQRARAAWEAAAVSLAPRAITLGRVVPLGASALSAIVDDADIAAAIGAARDEMHRAAGTPPDTRPPLPHVTVARVGRRADREAAVAWASRLHLETVAARIDDVALYTWAEDRKARLFRVVESRLLLR